jgi:hypothetical protein
MNALWPKHSSGEKAHYTYIRMLIEFGNGYIFEAPDLTPWFIVRVLAILTVFF